MTLQLPQKNIEINPGRLGPARLTPREKRALESIQDPEMRKQLGELFISQRGVQANLERLAQEFPIQPENVANSLRQDQILFLFTFRSGYPVEFDGEPAIIEFEGETETMEAITKMRMSYLDAVEKDIGHSLEYIASLSPAESVHHGLVVMMGEDSGAFLCFELTAKSMKETSGGELALIATVIPIVAGPPSPAFVDGESVALVLLGATQGEKGATGGKGDTGEKGAKGLIWQGEWKAAIEYAVDDAVEHKGSAYMALKAGKEKEPPNAEFWDLLAEKGETGAAGEKGAAGEAGLTWQGKWSSETEYVKGDATQNKGSSYIATESNKGAEP